MTISISDLEIKYGDQTIIDGLSLDIDSGEFLCLLGPSGCGKSTILRILGDLVSSQGGNVKIQGEEPTSSWKSMAYVFQSSRLAPWLNARDNVALGLKLRYPRMREARRAADGCMRTVGIEHLAEKPGHVLSGGEQQRVAIARALAVDPEILLMDEPFSALDVQTRHAMRNEVRHLWSRTGKSIVFVTHDVDEALALGSRIIVFSSKPTRILDDIAVNRDNNSDGFVPGYEGLKHHINDQFNEAGRSAD